MEYCHATDPGMYATERKSAFRPLCLHLLVLSVAIRDGCGPLESLLLPSQAACPTAKAGARRTHALAVRNAAWTTRTSDGCKVPGFRFCPWGAAGGTENHSVMYGRSSAFFSSNLVP